MHTAGYHLSIVVPIWNGHEQLADSLSELAAYVASRPHKIELVLSNDGSGPATVALLERFAAAHPEFVVLLHLPHRGKGATIADGMQVARGRFRAFIDSDRAFPAAETDKILAALESGADVAIASRVLPESRYVMSPIYIRYIYTRHIVSRILNALVRSVLLPGLWDTQAGLKGFSAAAAELIFPRLNIPGFGFDLECLYVARLNGMRISQVPVVFHYTEEPSTIRVSRDGLRFLADIIAIRWRGMLGVYTVEESPAPILQVAPDVEISL